MVDQSNAMAPTQAWRSGGVGAGRQCTGSCSARALYTHTSTRPHRPLTRPAPPSASQRRGVSHRPPSRSRRSLVDPLSSSFILITRRRPLMSRPRRSRQRRLRVRRIEVEDRGVCDGRDGSEEVVAPVMCLRRRPRQAPSSSPLGRALRRAPPLERRGRARRLRRRCCCPGRWPPLARAVPPPRGHAYASRLGRRIRKPSAHSV